ncbi:PLP-dependent aminotransferase family protein [Mesorhizobium sp. GR13]|uniref:MocR-like pyridoxine biosynthesis transcription factor PdxR n=1 Tax=Mesorhizobium sp. GR13 TaxID=2562308 RepID=UPI0010BFFD6A|nr:PLP-dependent aminotransferase family protein [Mesorhizobium sp. GR13]
MVLSSSLVFRLPRGSRLTLRDQVCEAVSAAIARGAIAPDAALPSCRELAEQLQVSRNTAFAAYSRLVDEGLLEARDRSGYYVANAEACLIRPESTSDEDDPVAPSPLPELAALPSRMSRVCHPEDWARYPYPFIYKQTDPRFFPIDAWRECSRQALSRKTIADWTRDSIEDDSPHLLQQIRQRLLAYRGITATNEEVMITVGAQNALSIIGLLMRDAEGVIAVEDPGFPDARNAFLTAGNRLVPAPIDAGGLVVEAIPRDCKLVYATPSHQFPTSVTMSHARRAALLAAASEQRFLILEDDYEAELDSMRKPEPSLRAIDTAGRVIYVGSMSKTLSPGLRLGYIVAHRDIIREARAIRRALLRHAPTLMQETMAYFLRLGHYDIHLRRTVSRKRDRWLRMDAAIREHLPQFKVQSSGGTSFWLTGDEGFDSTEFCHRLLRRGVIVDDGAVFHMQGELCRSFRMSFALVDPAQIDAGIRLIADEAMAPPA